MKHITCLTKRHRGNVPYLTAILEHPALKNHPLPPNLAHQLDPTANIGESISITEEVVARVSGRAGSS